MHALAAALVLAAGPSAPAGAGPAPDVPSLVRLCVEAYGGKEALARAAIQRQEGRVTSTLHPGGAGAFVRAYERPGRLRVEIRYPGAAPEVRVLDGGQGWRDGEPVEGPRLGAMILQAARLDMPALLSAWEAKVLDLGALLHAGKKLRVLAIEPAPGLIVEAAIDPGTGRILRTRGTSNGPPVPLEFETSYSDFRTVRGLLVPFREENRANGRRTGAAVLKRAELPASLPQGTFRP